MFTHGIFAELYCTVLYRAVPSLRAGVNGVLESYNNQPSLSHLPHPSSSQPPAVNAPTCATLPVLTQLHQQNFQW